MLGANPITGATLLALLGLDARQSPNSPRAAGLDDLLAWRASPLLHAAALDACSLQNSPAVVIAGARLPALPAALNSDEVILVTLPHNSVRRCAWRRRCRIQLQLYRPKSRESSASEAVADDGTGHGLTMLGHGLHLVAAWAATSLFGCLSERQAIPAGRLPLGTGSTWFAWALTLSDWPWGQSPANSAPGALRSMDLLNAASMLCLNWWRGLFLCAVFMP